jgi:membrane fusion protein, multidrug efflux system
MMFRSARLRVVLLGCILALNGCREQSGREEGREKRVVVETAKAEREKIDEVLTRVGSVRATHTVAVRPEISGIVRQIHFKEGDRVDANGLLYSLDDRKLRKQLAAQQAALEAARSRAEFASLMYQRYNQLVEEDAAAAAERDRREAESEAAQAEINRLQAEIALRQEQLQDTEIRSPMRAVAGESLVDEGDFVAVAESLTMLYSLSSEVRFAVPQEYTSRVSLGQDVRATVAAYPDESFHGAVNFVSPGVDERTRTFVVKAELNDSDQRLKSGTFMTVDLVLGTEADQPVIPSVALVATQTGYIVYVVEDGVAHRRSVEIGLRRPGAVQILGGVQETDRVVTSGQMRLTDGAKVRTSSDPNDASDSGEGARDHTGTDRGATGGRTAR